MAPKSGESIQGACSAAAAFFIWGLIPMYWKLMESINAYELMFHRVVWSFVFLLFVLKIRGRLTLFLQAFKDHRLVRVHSLGGILLAVNWLAFIIAVTSEQVLQASLAYFIVPLVNAGLGFLVLKERLSKLRVVGLILAGLGVVNEIIQVSEVPWLALIIAASFGCYGLLKKKTTLGAVTSLTLENTVIFPIALIGLLVALFRGDGVLVHGPWQLQGLVLFTGIVTSIPLLLFTYGAARIQLNTLGILQFLAPVLKFFLAVWIFHEPFSPAKLVTFLFIWAGLVIYLWDSYSVSRIKDVHPDL